MDDIGENVAGHGVAAEFPQSPLIVIEDFLPVDVWLTQVDKHRYPRVRFYGVQSNEGRSVDRYLG